MDECNFSHVASSDSDVKILKLLPPCLVVAATILPTFQALPPVHAQNTNTARVAQTDARLAKLENLLFELVNATRIKNGLKPLVLDSTLSDIARAHSAEMRDLKYFAHESPTSSRRTPLDRYRLGTGKMPRFVAENVYRSWGGRQQINDEQAQRAHNSLMNSPGHRANILHGMPTRIGIGFVANANGDLWVTQMFVKS